MTLRVKTEFERRHARQAVWPDALRTFQQHRKQVAYYGLHSLSRKHRHLYCLGQRLASQGMTAV